MLGSMRHGGIVATSNTNASATVSTSKAPAYTLKSAAKALGMSDQNLRRLIKAGGTGIVSEVRGIEGVEGAEHTVFTKASIEAYKAKRDSGEAGTPRVRTMNGAKAYLVRFTPEQAIAYMRFAEANNMPKLEARQKSSQTEEAKQKRKEYNAKRNAEKKAEREAQKAAQPQADQEAQAAAKLAREQAVNAERAARRSAPAAS